MKKIEGYELFKKMNDDEIYKEISKKQMIKINKVK